MTTFDSTLLPSGQDLATAKAEAAHAYELDRKHVFHSWSAQAQITPMTIVLASPLAPIASPPFSAGRGWLA